MKEYCLGFMFDESFSDVCLVLKNRPEILKGKFNGIGGKLENNETPIESMVREFKEETGVETHNNDWLSLDPIINNKYNIKIHTFYCLNNKVYSCRTMEDEEIFIKDLHEVLNIVNISPNVLPCLKSIIEKIDYSKLENKMSDVEKYEEIIQNVFGSLERGLFDESPELTLKSCLDYLEPYISEIESKNSQDPE